MIFQPFTTGYLITTTESIILTGKRTPPIWLTALMFLSTLLVLVGGILVLILVKVSTGHSDYVDTFLGVVALLVAILFPMNMVIRYYFRLENPITISRSDIHRIECQGAVLTLVASLCQGARPTTLVFNTRSQEEATTIEHNLTVHAHGRLRCYPVTFVPKNLPASAVPVKTAKKGIQATAWK